MRSLLIACIGLMLKVIPIGAAGAQGFVGTEARTATAGRGATRPQGHVRTTRQSEMAVVVRGAIAALVCARPADASRTSVSTSSTTPGALIVGGSVAWS